MAIRNGRESKHAYVQPYPGDLQDDSVSPFPGDWVTQAQIGNHSDPHGAAAYFAWTQTNSFLRFFSLVYNTAYIMGEPKHGMWSYKVEGASREFYWCDMGLSLSPGSDTSRSVGLGDHLPYQAGMDKFWSGVRQGFDPRELASKQFGPLAKEAKLGSFTVDVVRMEMSKGAYIWKNVGSGKDPRYEILATDNRTEYYILTAYYPDTPHYFRVHKSEGNSRRMLYSEPDHGLALHSFVIVVFPSDIAAETIPGHRSYGIHYDHYSTSCPGTCGSVECICDNLLIDLRLEGNLGPAWSKPDFGLPLALLKAPETTGSPVTKTINVSMSAPTTQQGRVMSCHVTCDVTCDVM